MFRELRKRSGMTQKELALEFGLCQAIISLWESGKQSPKISFLPKLTELFKTDYETLINTILNTLQKK